MTERGWPEEQVERRIREAIDSGSFDDLPGAGSPLVLEDDAWVPAEWRLTFLVLGRSGFAAEWLAQRGRNLADPIRRSGEVHAGRSRSRARRAAYRR